MKSILVVNPKGGCGKTTISTNLASYYAVWDVPTALVDYDPQKSASDWIRIRPDDASKIEAHTGLKRENSFSSEIKRVIYDAPARASLPTVEKLIKGVDIVLIPVLPSAIDMRVTAKFVADLLVKLKLRHKPVRIGVVGNRMQVNYKSSIQLEQFLDKVGIPYLAKLRASQNYVRGAAKGLGIFDMQPSLVRKDIESWKELISWIEAKDAVV